MNVQVKIPDEVFNDSDADVSREVLEAVAIDGFRTGQLSIAQLRRLLGFKNRDEAHNFLKEHGIPWVDYSASEVKRERELLKEILP